MQKLSFKICAFCNCSFMGYKAQKYCLEHKNKICRDCKKIKEKHLQNNWKSMCLSCESKRTTKYYFKKKLSDPEYFKTDKFRKRKLEQRKKYVKANQNKIKDYYQKNKKSICEKQKEYINNNIEKVRIYRSKYYQKNKERLSELNKKNSKKYIKNNPHVALWRGILYRVTYYFGTKKEKATNELLGYSAEQLKLNIESKFLDGMSWDNWGEWHLDHIKPIVLFDKNTPVSVVNSLDNLRPLWKLDNLRRKKRQVND